MSVGKLTTALHFSLEMWTRVETHEAPPLTEQLCTACVPVDYNYGPPWSRSSQTEFVGTKLKLMASCNTGGHFNSLVLVSDRLPSCFGKRKCTTLMVLSFLRHMTPRKLLQGLDMHALLQFCLYCSNGHQNEALYFSWTAPAKPSQSNECKVQCCV